jgi:hypothetical protein
LPVPNPSRDEQLLAASIAHASPSHLVLLTRDHRPWVRKIAREEVDRRQRERADEVVCREPLRQIVNRFVAEWRVQRPARAGQFAPTGTKGDRASLTFVGAVDYLADNSGVPRGTIENITRSKSRSPVVPFDVADALVAAIGDPTPMYDGTLQPTTRSNPCCSGSSH